MRPFASPGPRPGRHSATPCRRPRRRRARSSPGRKLRTSDPGAAVLPGCERRFSRAIGMARLGPGGSGPLPTEHSGDGVPWRLQRQHSVRARQSGCFRGSDQHASPRSRLPGRPGDRSGRHVGSGTRPRTDERPAPPVRRTGIDILRRDSCRSGRRRHLGRTRGRRLQRRRLRRRGQLRVSRQPGRLPRDPPRAPRWHLRVGPDGERHQLRPAQRIVLRRFPGAMSYLPQTRRIPTL